MSSQTASTNAGPANPDGARVRQYRQAERRVWDHYGLEATEQFIELGLPRLRLRVVEVGTGRPVLLVGGTGGTGPYWAPLVSRLHGFRCLMLDRPGFGLSSALDYSGYDYKAVSADVLEGVLDAFGVERAHVVGASIGNVWALRLATRHPERVSRTVLLGGGPLVPAISPPPFIRLLRTPLGAVVVRIPEKPRMLRSQLRGLGHGPSLDAGRVPAALVDLHIALTRHTDSLRNEREMVRAILGPKGWRPGLTFDDAELSAVAQPTLMIYGTSDPVGSVEVWRRFVATMPHGELYLVDDGGHQPWYDDPDGVGERIRGFLRG